jgi:endoglucanase
MSEFGIQGQGFVNQTEQRWFNNFTQYLIDQDLDFAIWPLTGYLNFGSGNGWALLSWDLGTKKRVGIYDGADWRADKWRQLVGSPGRQGPVPAAARFKMLNVDHADFIQSRILRAQPDWDPGAFKATCPDGMRLLGLSRGANRGLCTDKAYEADLWLTAHNTTVVRDESSVSQDWASGYTKFECPKDQYAIGYAFRGVTLSSLLCATAKRALGLQARTIWFDQTNGGESIGGDFAYGLTKGVCAEQEYIAGVAFTTKVSQNPQPAAILCRQ